jgi:integrase
MARKARKNAWQSPLFKFGAVYERSGNAAYTFTYQGRRFRKVLPLKFVPGNRVAAIQLLEHDIRTVLEGKPKHPGMDKMLSDVIKEYKAVVLKDATGNVLDKHRQAFAYYLDVDFPIVAFEQIQHHLVEREAAATFMPSTRRKRHQCLRRFFKFCVNCGFLLRSPADILEKPVIAETEAELYTIEEVRAIIANLRRAKRIEAALCTELLLITGMRIGECLGLEWSDIDHEKISIWGKGKKKRIFPLGLDARLPQILSELKTLRGSEQKLFQWQHRVNIDKHFVRAMEEEGIERRGRSLHTIRKTTGWYMENELNYTQEMICDLLGHSLAIRAKHYRRKLQADELLKKAEAQQKLRRNTISEK